MNLFRLKFFGGNFFGGFEMETLEIFGDCLGGAKEMVVGV